MATGRPTILCLASYEKGHDFLRACAEAEWNVILLTSESLKDKHRFPVEALTDIYYMPDDNKMWDPHETKLAVSHLARSRVFDRVVPLDDFDLEIAAQLREHLRVPGMGDTTTRHFRDKLAMRVSARSAGLLVPEFVHLLNDEKVKAFTERVPPPWVVKPRSLGGSIGIKKVESREQLAEVDAALGDDRTNYVLEKHVKGDVFHVDSLVFDGTVRFALASRYGRPPLDVTHTGDVFTTVTLPHGSEREQELLDANEKTLKALRLRRGASHTEFIRGEDGQIYFLETSARVGGAHVADLVEAASGVNLWREWGRIEMCGDEHAYSGPDEVRRDYAGLVITLAKQEKPDLSSFTEPEIVWRMDKANHVGLIVREADHGKLTELVNKITDRVRTEFHAFVPPPDRPTE